MKGRVEARAAVMRAATILGVLFPLAWQSGFTGREGSEAWCMCGSIAASRSLQRLWVSEWPPSLIPLLSRAASAVKCVFGRGNAAR